jgi:hypothetical protein
MKIQAQQAASEHANLEKELEDFKTEANKRQCNALI